MRILVISNYYPPVEIGGWEQLTRDVSDELARRGHQLQVLTSNHKAQAISRPEPTIARQLHLQSPQPFHYQARSTLQARGHDRQNNIMLAAWVSRFQPDLIFINGLWNVSPRLALAAEQLLPGRVVYYMASPWPVEPDVHAVFWADPAGRIWRRWPKKVLGAILKPIFLPRFPALAFQHVLCVSGYIQNMMVNQVGVPRPNTQVVYNGIEPELFTVPKVVGQGCNLAWDTARPGLRLLYAGQIRADKGLHTAIEALGQHPYSLTIVGGGSPGYIQQLQDRVHQLGLEEVVTFRGQVSREEMPAIFAAHNVLLFPSIWPEPLARVVQEAMACGLVVIGTTTGGTPEILQDGHNGLTFAAENSAELAAKIGHLAANPSLAQTLATNARQTIETRFTFSRMVDQLENYFHVPLCALLP